MSQPYDYKTIFDKRAKDYINALISFPDVRKDEINNFINLLALKKNEKFLDAPCGTGICSNFLNGSIQYTGLDPCAVFIDFCKNKGLNTFHAEMDQKTFSQDHFDVIGSLAGVHHISDRKSLYSEWYRILKPGGRLIILDIAKNSPTSKFLNHFVDEYNSTGHQGLFLDKNDKALLDLIGFKKIENKDIDCTWSALNREAMYNFFRTLFALDKLPNNLLLHEELNKNFKITETNLGYQLIWPLKSITAIKI